MRRCRVRHLGAYGIRGTGAASLTVDCTEVINVGAPAYGPEVASNRIGITLDGCPNSKISRVTGRDCSSVIYAHRSDNTSIYMINGYNVRGPMPRGQLVQFDKSPNCLLENFYAFNDATISYPEDVVSVYESPNVTMRLGVIDGCNAPSGVGVMCEGGSTNCIIEDVDAINIGNGAFAAYSGSMGVIFRRCRARGQIGLDQGRGKPTSRGWNETDRRNIAPALAVTNSSDAQFIDCVMHDIPGLASYGGSLTETAEAWEANYSGGPPPAVYQWVQEEFEPRQAWLNNFVWVIR